MRKLIFTFAVLAMLVLPSGAKAAFGDGFGVSDKAGGTAFPTEKAFWAGTCDTGTPSVGSGGYAAGPGAVPTLPQAHCIDTGRGCVNCFAGRLWMPGGEPAWRLDPVAQAGGHPDGTVALFVHSYPVALTEPDIFTRMPDGEPRDVAIKVPAGVTGDPTAVPKCPSEALAFLPAACPPETQVGVLTAMIGNFEAVFPIWNVEPRDGNAAEFVTSPGHFEPKATIPIVAEPRTDGDFGIDTFVTRIPGGIPLLGQAVTLWGVPWSAEHDRYRPKFGYSGEGGLSGMPLDGASPANRVSYDPSWGPVKPFFANPTECSGELLTTVAELTSWQNPDVVVVDSVPTDVPVDGCEAVGFDPEISLSPTGTSADSPTGLAVDLEIPQNNDLPFDPPEPGADQGDVDQYLEDADAHWKSEQGLATSHLKDTVVTLPEGYTINPSAVNGQAVCGSSQIGLTSPIGAKPIRFNNDDPSDGAGADCPQASKIGTVVIETPLLEQADWPEGEVYLAAQRDNPFGSDYAIYIAVRSPKRGLVIKLAGQVEPDPATGQLTTTFADNPQLPFDRFRLRFKGGARAPLATPPVCGATAGTYRSRTELAPYSAPGDPVVIEGNLVVSQAPGGGPCATSQAARPFTVGLSAGSAQVGAGQYSAFRARFTRSDGQQEFDRIELSTPEGLSGKLAGVPYCPEAGIARAVGRTATGDGAVERRDPSCPAASKVGTTTVGAGAGPNPFYVSGDVYLAGPYKGAPLSMVFIVPAVAGPFDLGVQVVRAKLQVDPFTAQITTVSDEIPKILRGVPLRVRDVRVDITRPEFTLNPTDCSEQQVAGRVFGASGAVTSVSNRFQVDGCRDLGFAPRFRAKILDKGRRSTLRSFNPRTRFVVVPRPGDANIGGARVALPSSTILDQSNLDTTCTRARMAAEDCPAGSVVGYATAWSPLLDRPVQGPVYLAANGGVRPLPDLMAVLDGQIRVSLLGEVSTLKTGGKARLQNTFRVVPDAPVSRFVLTMRGGKNRGLLVNSTDLCRSRERGVAVFHAQNGRVDRQRLRIATSFKGCKRVRKQAARKAAKRKQASKAGKRAAKRLGRSASGSSGAVAFSRYGFVQEGSAADSPVSKRSPRRLSSPTSAAGHRFTTRRS